MNSSVSPKLERDDEKRMLPCRFYANGYCQRGIRCRFYHPSTIAASTAIKVPALPANFGNSVSIQTPQAQATISQRQMNGVRRDNGPPPIQENTYHRRRQGFATSSPLAPQNIAATQSIAAPWNTPPGPSFQFGNQPPRNFFGSRNGGESYSNSCTPSASSSCIGIEQNTFFKHINWLDFLAPGYYPPPPIKVPETPISPAKKEDRRNGNNAKTVTFASDVIDNEDMPPEGSKISIENNENKERKLTPSEELQMKVRQIAQEIAQEPKGQVVLDSFFLNYDFSRKGFSAEPSEMVGEISIYAMRDTGEQEVDYAGTR